MFIESHYKPEKCVSTDETRRVLQYIKLDELDGKQVAVATDGRMIVVVPASFEEVERGKLVPSEAIAIARDNGSDLDGDASVNTVRVGKLTLEYKPEKDLPPFPNWKNCLPQFESSKKVVILCPAFLHALADALGAEFVSLTIDTSTPDPSTLPILVTGPSKHAFGVLMPARHEA